MPALGIVTCTPSAITGSSPIGENSVVPMPNAPTASASSGSVERGADAAGEEEAFMAAGPVAKRTTDARDFG